MEKHNFETQIRLIIMGNNELKDFIKTVLENMPNEWLNLTTHRLDIYNETLAKTEFLEQFESLYKNKTNLAKLNELPTAFDYIRLGHPLSCVLEWAIAKLNGLKPENVISFSSQTTPTLAILRKNLLTNTKTQIVYTKTLPNCFDVETIKNVYGYNFDLKKIETPKDIADFDGSTILVAEQEDIFNLSSNGNVDFYVNNHPELGSVIIVNGDKNGGYVSEIQHVRRRETIAMTPINCFAALKQFTAQTPIAKKTEVETNKAAVLNSIKQITTSNSKAVVGSSGLSIQYAIVMGLIDNALENYPKKGIKIIVPPNCYGGTNDQARRVAACINNVEVLDLPVDGNHNMVQSIDSVLNNVANADAVPFIIAEIPTNPRVEVPDLNKLKEVLSKTRKTASDNDAIKPIFILDQTFCPNVHFLGEDNILSSVKTISYVSGSKFPSGGKCTAGYCAANKKAEALMDKIEKHLMICDNEATASQYSFLAEQMPSMNQRITEAYQNTREFVNFINEVLPEAKINFVSEELAEQGFTPSVFSLDLPTKGDTHEERETYKRQLNDKLINMMITEIPNESKYCVSYGQLKGCYWTIPATSTQGTTKESDKDYIARVALSPNMDLEHHKKVFSDFIKDI